jgi:hypothetical protein
LKRGISAKTSRTSHRQVETASSDFAYLDAGLHDLAFLSYVRLSIILGTIILPTIEESNP